MRQVFDCRLIYDSGEDNYLDITLGDIKHELYQRGIELIFSQNSDIPVLIVKEKQ